MTIKTLSPPTTDNPDLFGYALRKGAPLPEIYFDPARNCCIAEFDPSVDLVQIEAEFLNDRHLQKFLSAKKYFFSRVRTLNPQRGGRP